MTFLEQQHRNTDSQRNYTGPFAELTSRIIGAAIEVHRNLGPGLLESICEECFAHELQLRGIAFRRQVDLPVNYKGIHLPCGFRIDLLVETR